MHIFADMKRLLITLALGFCATMAGAQPLSYQDPTLTEAGRLPSIAEGLLDTTSVETLGLRAVEGTRTVTIFSPTDETHHYANGVVMTAFKGLLYCMWQSSQTDGLHFDRAYLLRSGGNDLQPQRYPGKYKTLGYSYPKSMVHDGNLYVAYATNKEDVECTVIPLHQK